MKLRDRIEAEEPDIGKINAQFQRLVGMRIVGVDGGGEMTEFDLAGDRKVNCLFRAYARCVIRRGDEVLLDGNNLHTPLDGVKKRKYNDYRRGETVFAKQVKQLKLPLYVERIVIEDSMNVHMASSDGCTIDIIPWPDDEASDYIYQISRQGRNVYVIYFDGTMRIDSDIQDRKKVKPDMKAINTQLQRLIGMELVKVTRAADMPGFIFRANRKADCVLHAFSRCVIRRGDEILLDSDNIYRPLDGVKKRRGLDYDIGDTVYDKQKQALPYPMRLEAIEADDRMNIHAILSDGCTLDVIPWPGVLDEVWRIFRDGRTHYVAYGSGQFQKHFDRNGKFVCIVLYAE